MHPRDKRTGEAGFTIVEFLIATAVFSVVMLLCAYAIVHVGRMYYKGVITNRTQDTARRVVEDVAAAIQFGSSPSVAFVRPQTEGEFSAWCVGGQRYTYTTGHSLGREDDQLPHVLWRDRYTADDCPSLALDASPDPGGIDGTELLGENMRITRFAVNDLGGGTYEVSIRIAYGNTLDLFVDDDPEQPCKGSNAGGQFCATSEFKTQVKKRLSR